jgi:hypothetical protein
MSQPVRPGAPTFGRPEGKSKSPVAGQNLPGSEEVESFSSGDDKVEFRSRDKAPLTAEKSRRTESSAPDKTVGPKEKNKSPNQAAEPPAKETQESKSSTPDPKTLAKMKEQANLRMIGNLSSKFFERNYVEAPVIKSDDFVSSRNLKNNNKTQAQQHEEIPAEIEQATELENVRAIRELRDEQPRNSEDNVA